MIFKGKGIFINPDLTKLQMDLEYKMRQEKRLVANLSEMIKIIYLYVLKGKQYINMIKLIRFILCSKTPPTIIYVFIN